MIHSTPGHRPTLTLRGKIIGLILAATIGSLLVLSVENFFSTRTREHALALEALEVEAQRYADQIESLFQGMESDVVLLATMPTTDAIGALLDEAPGTRRDEALNAQRARLESFYSKMLLARPHYSQLRLIGRDDNWRELVRVNRVERRIEVVPGKDLQQKGDEPYMQRIRYPIRGRNYFSNITLNREHGQVDGLATIRIVRPLFNHNNKPYAAVVINADVAALLHEAAPNVADNIRTTAVTSNLDYMTFESRTSQPRLHFHTDSDWTETTAIRALLASDGSQAAMFHDDHAVYIREVRATGTDRPFSLYMITEKSRADLFAAAKDRLKKDAIISFALIAIAGFAALITASRLTFPLRELRRKISALEDSSEPIELGALSKDEVGDLAGIFMTRSNDLMPAALRARAVFDSAGHAIIVFDENGLIEEVNEAAAQLFGDEATALVRRPVSELLMSDQICGLNCFKCTGPQHCIDTTVFGRHRDGHRIALAISVARTRYAGANHVIAVMQDVTEQKRAEAKIQRLVNDLERSNAELDQFAYVASHDLKAPLRVIENTSNWLAEDLEDVLTEDTRDSLDLLRNRVGRMTRLLDALLAHSRIGRVPVDRDWISFDVMIDEIEGLLDSHDGFEIAVDPELLRCTVIRLPLQTVLLNLISNAIRHHDRDRGTIRIGFRDLGDVVEYSVADDGPGIPERFHQKIFEPFQTLKPRDQVDTSGVGLAMVRKHVSLVGGTIRLESDGVRGTTFFVVWPKDDDLSNHCNDRRLAS
ncbi:sensor histidine kinase [Tropicibacter sp. S64]|uniref:sensor histidine kinase n=1 Tax=Tropicibacter sp. S64 TaxID=3415122 RepID=UPI003C7DAFB5